MRGSDGGCRSRRQKETHAVAKETHAVRLYEAELEGGFLFSP
jgi:hypothetical protein